MALRHRPNGQPVMHQNWGKLLFMHWRVDEELLRPLVPEPLSLDLYGGKAWMPLADLAQAFGFIINWSNLRAGQAINVNAAANSNAILIGL